MVAPQIILPDFHGQANVWIYGDVINRTFLPPFRVSVPGILNCSFTPIETPFAEQDRYETGCEYAVNLTSTDQIYVPFPLKLLKQYENITAEERELSRLRGENLFLWIALIASIIVAVLAFVMGRLDEIKEEVE